ncbi:MAG: Lrp/AsnC family transcriptional regulator [Tannerella sp.]|jgi:DNA-binding Lrp family transcriptional regulator|nr:Lrp/AsnC family transcriptional regulator [Tannerella sp.]
MESLDAIDIKLLKLLQENSNRTVKELAALVNLSPTPVFERIKRLEKEGYIKKYTAILSNKKLNKGFVVFCNVKLKHHSIAFRNQFIKTVSDMPEITECYNTSGDYDFMLKIFAQSMEHYKNFIVDILNNEESIGSLQSIFVMEEIKHTYNVPF